MFTKHVVKISLLAAAGIAFWVQTASAQGQYGGAQQNPKPDQSTSQQPPSAEQKGGLPDAQTITAAMKDDAGLARVSVQATAEEVTLTGTVADKSERDKAEQIVQQYAHGRKVNNKIRINPNVHPAPGF